MILGRFGALILALLLAACSIGTPRPPVPPPPPSPSPTPTATPLPTSTPARLVARPSGQATPATPATPSAAAPCTPERAEWAIGRFLVAFNRGDRAELAERLAQPDAHGFDPFRWFRVAEGSGEATVLTARDAVVELLLARQGEGERLGLVEVIAPTEHVATVDGISVSLVSQHPEKGERMFTAKVLVDCGRARIHAWTMSDAAAPGGVRVLGDEGPLPPGCWSAEEVAEFIVRFFAAFNRGDQAALVQLFPAESAGFSNANPEQLQWYSVSEGNPPTRTFVARDRETLMRYFADRHAHAERLSLLLISVGAGWHGGADFSYEIARSADDLAATAEGTPNAAPGDAVAVGKGAINCSKGTIFVWSMGTR